MRDNLPNIVTPDRIRDAIVKVFFSSEIPYEPLIGYIHRELKDKFEYPYKSRDISGSAILEDLFASASNNSLFTNEEIKIELQSNNCLTFNYQNNYIGWNKYGTYIQDVLNKLFDTKIIQKIQRIEVRFVSEFVNIDISDKIQFSYNSTCFDKEILSTNFRLRWIDDVHNIVLTLGNKLPIKPFLQPEDDFKYVSLIDISVSRENLDDLNLQEVFKILNETKYKQKLLFFSLLTDEFLNSLNPIYD